jgi:hypothetical protein
MARSGTIIVSADGDALAVWVNQHFVAVKPISVRRLARTIDAVSVQLPDPDSGDKDVPVMRSAIGCWIELYDSGRLLGVSVIKENDLYLRGVGRENAKSYAGGS